METCSAHSLKTLRRGFLHSSASALSAIALFALSAVALIALAGAAHASAGGFDSSAEARAERLQGSGEIVAQAAVPEGESDGAGVAEVISLGELMAAFAQMPGLEATFEEEKHIGLLAAPLRSSGRLYFMRPGRLARFVDAPRPSQVLITPEMVHFSDATGSQMIALTGRPELSALVESMVWLLSGDAASLNGAYAPAMTGTTEAWTLTLTPREEPLSHLIAEMTVMGSGYAVQEIRVVETTGDETRTRILDADPAREFTDEERERLFEPAPL